MSAFYESMLESDKVQGVGKRPTPFFVPLWCRWILNEFKLDVLVLRG